MNPPVPPRPTRAPALTPSSAAPPLRDARSHAVPMDGWGRFYPRLEASSVPTATPCPAPIAPMPIVAEALVAQLPENLDCLYLNMSAEEQSVYSTCVGQLVDLHLGEREMTKQVRATAATPPTQRLDFVARVCASYADLRLDLQQRLQDVHGAAGKTLANTLEQFDEIPWQSWHAAVDCMFRLAAHQPASWCADELARALSRLTPSRWPVLETTLNAVCEASPKNVYDATAALEPRALWATQLAEAPFDLWLELMGVATDCFPPQAHDATGTPLLMLCLQAVTQIDAEATAKERPAAEAYQFLQLVKAVFAPGMATDNDAKIVIALRDACLQHGVDTVYGTVVNTAMNDTMSAPQRRVVLQAIGRVTDDHASLFYQLITHFAAVDDDALKAKLVVAVSEPHAKLATMLTIMRRLADAHVCAAQRGWVAGKLLAIVSEIELMDMWCTHLVAKKVTGEALYSAMLALAAVPQPHRINYFKQAVLSNNATLHPPR